MSDDRSGDPHPDGLPEEASDADMDSPPAAQDDAARADVEEAAGERTQREESDPRVS